MTDADVLVVGAGAAGIGTARLLRRAGVSVLVLDAGDAPGDSWRRRYERLRLHTARRWSHVAAARLRSPDRFVRATSFADHVSDAATGLDLRMRSRVVGVRRGASGTLAVTLQDGTVLHGSSVVLATGQNERPQEPHLPSRARYRGTLLHADAWRTGADFAGLDVLVVGVGNTGTEIAQDLVEHGARTVTVSMRSVPQIVPRSIAGVPAHAVAVTLSRVLGVRGMQRVTRIFGSIRGRRRLAQLGLYPPTDPGRGIPTMDHGFVAEVAAGNVRLVPALVDLDESGAQLADGSRVRCDAIVLATGYRPGALELLSDELAAGVREQDLGMPGVRARNGIWFVGFGPAPLGQLMLARHHARLVIREILSRG